MDNISFNSLVFPDPYKLSTEATAPQVTQAEEHGTHNARTVAETPGAGGQIDPGIRPFKRKNLLTDYKVTTLKKIKLIVKYAVKGAKKGAKIGGIAGLVTGGIKAVFTGNLLAIPIYGGLGAGIGGAITGTSGATKGLKAVRNLTPAGLIEEKVKDVREDVEKLAKKAESSLKRADYLFSKLQKNMIYSDYRCKPSGLKDTSTLRGQVKMDARTLAAMERKGTLNKPGKKTLQDLRKLMIQLDISRVRNERLAKKEQIVAQLEQDLALVNDPA